MDRIGKLIGIDKFEGVKILIGINFLLEEIHLKAVVLLISCIMKEDTVTYKNF